MEEVSSIKAAEAAGNPFERELRERCGQRVSIAYLNDVCTRDKDLHRIWLVDYAVETTLHFAPVADGARGEALTVALEFLEERVAVADFVCEMLERRDRLETINTDPIRMEIAEAKAVALRLRARVDVVEHEPYIAPPDMPALLSRDNKGLLYWLIERVCEPMKNAAAHAISFSGAASNGDAQSQAWYGEKLRLLRHHFALALTVTDELIGRVKT